MKLKGLKINFLGDSITEGYGVSDSNNVYWKRLETNEALAVARCYGIRGTRYATRIVPSVTPRLNQNFCDRYNEMDDDADVVVVFGGTNDYGSGGDVPLGTPSDRTPYTFYGACHTLYSGLVEKYPSATIVIMTPLHRLTEEPTATKKDKPPLSAYVAIEQEVAEFYALPVLDLWATSGIQPRLPIIQERYVPDGLHPNDAGHELLYKRLAGFLKSL